MIPLATLEQLADFRGVAADATDVKALRHLEGASGVFRSLARQTISLVEDDVVELEGTWVQHLHLPERPVLEVSDVAIVHPGRGTTTVADGTLEITRRGLLRRSGGWGGPAATVRLTYTHGWDPVPDDIVEVVCAMATRRMSNPRGVISRTIDTYSEAFAQDAGSNSGLTAWELKVVQRYQPWGD